MNKGTLMDSAFEAINSNFERGTPHELPRVRCRLIATLEPRSWLDRPAREGGCLMKSRVSDPRNRAAPRACANCGDMFAPHRKRENAKWCSGHCVWVASKGPEFNARIARASAALRGNLQRGRGEGKTYRKLNGRHEHRAVAEEKLGRPLAPWEIVHHRDDSKQNNEPSNLDVLASQSEHAKLHFSGKKHSPEHIRKRMASKRLTMQSRRESK